MSLKQIIVDAERLASRLKERQTLAEAILEEAEGVNNQLETMRQFKDDLDLLNSLARDKSNKQMIHTINQENPQIREMHSENIRLRAALEDHQRALEHIMSKYREHSQAALMKTKINFEELFRGETEKNVLIRRQEEKIQEMIAIMQRAATLDDPFYEQNLNRDRENIKKLVIENQGLRELLEISKKFRSCNKFDSDGDHKISTETQTDSDLLLENGPNHVDSNSSSTTNEAPSVASATIKATVS